MIRTSNVRDGFIDTENVRYVTQDTYRHWTRRLVPERGDVILTREAPLGDVGMVRTDEPIFLGQRLYHFRPDPTKLDAHFLLYALMAPDLQGQIAGFGSGATVEHMRLGDIPRLEVTIPPLSDQKQIGGMLSAYDELIENNNRRMKILKEIVRTLYCEWFVRFRFPGHESFSFIDSPVGKTPSGWVRSYSDYVDFLEGPGLRNWQYRNEGLPFLNIRTLVDDDIHFSKLQYLDEQEVMQKYSHFLLQPYDHVVSSSGTLGRIVTVQERHLPLMLNTSIIRMRPRTKAVGRWQLKHFLQSDYFQGQIRAHASGVAQPNYGPSHLKMMWILAPNEKVGQTYESIVTPFEELICTLVNQNANLRRTRDLLLPALVSGEIAK